ncbi:hypothetical protein H6G25_15020 [Dolichospermum sp. FACHB-1091]|jgi:hypothetical protein|uniref:hypothetical protein n=1 Tax=Dolichospermum sp. FACHB-1091 TaxID=2692798 RepID=UPI00168002A2|nr:hypothetical protein [Dolichospermum sp. FACHB-1091]MBD2444476.1 hypothetical protein [Dolichospermum sp. FACHB-1091]
MFISELSPLVKEFAQNPVSFMGGFVSGVLRLNLNEEPVKSWLDKKCCAKSSSILNTDVHNGKANTPQQITID